MSEIIAINKQFFDYEKTEERVMTDEICALCPYLPMFFILIFASGGISSGSLCTARGVRLTCAQVLCVGQQKFNSEHRHLHRHHR